MTLRTKLETRDNGTLRVLRDVLRYIIIRCVVHVLWFDFVT